MSENLSSRDFATDRSDPYRAAFQSRSLSNRQLLLIAGVTVFAVGSRILPTSWLSFTCLISLAVFSGAVLPSRFGWLLPLLARIITDAAFHLKTGHGYFNSWPFDYSSYILIYFMCRNLPVRQYSAVMGRTVGALALYFVLSNLGVWMMEDFHPHTFAGLMGCYISAIPFVRGMVIGNLIAAPVFFFLWNAVSATECVMEGAPASATNR